MPISTSLSAAVSRKFESIFCGVVLWPPRPTSSCAYQRYIKSNKQIRYTAVTANNGKMIGQTYRIHNTIREVLPHRLRHSGNNRLHTLPRGEELPQSLSILRKVDGVDVFLRVLSVMDSKPLGALGLGKAPRTLAPGVVAVQPDLCW